MKDPKQDTEKRIVVLDHFDSFTYNLVTAFERLGATVQVFRTDTDIRRVADARPTHLVLSPGPGHPRDVSLFAQALSEFKERVPILGVCLGEQAIGLHFGAEVGLAPVPMHGKTSLVFHRGEGLFEGIPPSPFKVSRYHSLMVNAKRLDPKRLAITADCKDGTVMAIQSVKYPTVMGVQFHPESLFTEHGEKLLDNFLKIQKAEKISGGYHHEWGGRGSDNEWSWQGWQTRG